MTVVEEGRHSVGLLPIPADRERQQPLPEDTVEVELLVVDGDGEIDPETLDVRWLSCVPGVPCTQGQRWRERPPCLEDRLPAEPCSLGSQPRLRYTIPPFNADEPLFAQYQLAWLTVAGVPAERDTASCLDDLAKFAPEDLDGCLIALHLFELGPIGPFLAAAERDGFELGVETVPLDLAAAAQPGFNPELTELAFTDFPGSTVAVARPGEPTRVPPAVELYRGNPDFRDSQAYVFASVAPDGSFIDAGTTAERLSIALYSTEPGRMDGPFSSAIQTGEVGESFSILAVVRDGRGGQAWEWLDFEVEP